MRITLAILAVLCIGAHANPEGAPNAACVTLVPSMNFHQAPQGDMSPYTITTDAMDNYYKSDPVKIMLTGDNVDLRGIICQVRKEGDSPIGTFTVPTAKASMYKTMMCSNNADTVTHMNRQDKGMEAYFMWTPPGGDMGPLKVVCSFVKVQTMHWDKVQAEHMLMYHMESGDGMDDGMDSSSDEADAAGSIYGNGTLSLFVVLAANFLRRVAGY